MSAADFGGGAVGGGVGGVLGLVLAVATWRHRLEGVERRGEDHGRQIVLLVDGQKRLQRNTDLILDHLGIKRMDISGDDTVPPKAGG